MTQDEYPSDAELAAGLRRNEDAAKVAFVRRYQPRIDMILQRLRIGAADRDELFFKVTERVIAQAVQKPISKLGSYTMSAALNAGRDFLRGRGSVKQTGLASFERIEQLGGTKSVHPLIQELRGSIDGSGLLASRNAQAVRLMEEALGELSENDQAVLLMRAKEMSYEEIGHLLQGSDCSIDDRALRQRHKRALVRLKDAYNRRADAAPREVQRELEACGLRTTHA